MFRTLSVKLKSVGAAWVLETEYRPRRAILRATVEHDEARDHAIALQLSSFCEGANLLQWLQPLGIGL